MKKIAFITALFMLMTISFAAAENTGKENYPYVDENGNIVLADYFSSEGAALSLRDESIDLILTSNNASVKFKQTLASDGFSVRWSGADGNDGLKKVEFILTDSEDENCSVMITYSKLNETNTSIVLNSEKQSYIVNGSTYKASDSDFQFTYDSLGNAFSDGSNLKMPVMSCLNGNAFIGFSSKLIRLEIKIYGDNGNLVRLGAINQQRFGTAYQTDNVAPFICVSDNRISAAFGSVIALPTAFAKDVLSQKSVTTMTVKDPDGKVVKDTAGKELKDVSPDKNYKIKISKYGSYRLSYIASDGINSTRSITRQIFVNDCSAPAVTLNKNVPPEMKVGEKYTFPEMKVSDNVSLKENIKTWITVKIPSGYILLSGKSVELSEKGQYVFTFYAMDEAGNIAKTVSKTYAAQGE